jgi:spore germination protein KB
MNESVPERQGIALVFLFIVGDSFVFGLARWAGRDLWLSFLVAIVLASPLILVYGRLGSLMHGQPFSEALPRLLGKWPSRLVALTYSAYAWRLGCFVTGDITNFVQAVSLPDTPQVVMAFGYAILVLWAVKEGIEVLARFSSVMIIVVLLILLTALGLAMTEVNLQEFLPIMYDGFWPVLQGAFQILDFPLLETVLFIGLANALTTKKRSAYKVLIPGFLLAAFFLMLFASASVAILGEEAYMTSYFPVFMSTARIDIALFLTRLEAVVGVTFAIGTFLKISVCLLVASKTLAHTLGFSDYRFLVTPLVLSIIPGSQWFAKSIMEMEQSATKIVGFTDVVVQVALPLVMWIVAEIRMSKERKNKAGKPSGI